jgi:hypothetical protein
MCSFSNRKARGSGTIGTTRAQLGLMPEGWPSIVYTPSCHARGFCSTTSSTLLTYILFSDSTCPLPRAADPPTLLRSSSVDNMSTPGTSCRPTPIVVETLIAQPVQTDMSRGCVTVEGAGNVHNHLLPDALDIPNLSMHPRFPPCQPPEILSRLP